MVQPHGRIAALFFAAALLTGAGPSAMSQDAVPEKLPRAPDGTAFVISLYPKNYDTPYLRETFGHLLYLAPQKPPVDAGEIVGRLLEELGNLSRDRNVEQKPVTYCLYREPGAPEFEEDAADRVKKRGIDLRPVTLRQRDVAVKSGECVLVNVAAAAVDDLPPPVLEVERRVFETADARVILRGRVTAAGGYGQLYLDKEQIPFDRETGEIDVGLVMPAPGEEATHELFALDRQKQQSNTILLTLRRLDIPPPRIYDYSEVVESEAEVAKVYGYVTSRRPLAAVIVGGREARLDRDSGTFEALVDMPPLEKPRQEITIEAYDADKRRGTAVVVLRRIAPEPPPVAPPVIIADRTRVSSRDASVEITGYVESELAVAVVRVGDVPAALDGKTFRAGVTMPAPFETATLLVTAADAEGNRAEPLRVTLERLPWCPPDLLRGRDEVRQVQAQLNELGYDAGAADGLPGRKTSAAMDAFWKRSFGDAECKRGDFIGGLTEAVDDSRPPPPPEPGDEEIVVADVPTPPEEIEPPLDNQEPPVIDDTRPPPPEEAAPPSLRFDGEPISAWDARATVTGHALGDMNGWRLVFANRPVPVAADGSFRFPVDGLTCGSNWLEATLLGVGGQSLPSRFEVRRSSSLGTWYCHAATAPLWVWALPVVLLLLAALAAAKLRKPPRPAAAPRLRLEAARGADFSAEVVPGPQLRLALRIEDEIQTTEVIVPDPPARLKEAAG